ncbi:MAG: hypothetical protein A3G78_00355 [Alphaproteobacteria bacterium RIFCSPLOWO2_12_FULL_42_29]|nr:MAG: hypothetical protein A3H46_03435 [Alphaproteobacteria bacterium RIFCSPLOWO2_02_FULL_43_54]OFX07930.1 MAG: hypothetical protein A3G78_00355 [Alphaproteobacteria bacterium RIFCSPLOWO2_12_FULL_42_29]
MAEESLSMRALLRLLSPGVFFFMLVSLESSLWANNCAIHISQHEKAHNIPEGLLHAISKVESGHKDATGHIVAWPWTVNAEGEGYYFPSKETAIAAVRKMQLKGISSIDIGCMQVNLQHHPHAFKTLEDAFDPRQNVAYAARFLKGLKNEHASWHKAVAHYHSANPLHHIPYQRNVMLAWKHNRDIPALILAKDRFKDRKNANHIRRLNTQKTLSLSPPQLLQASSNLAVRRVSSHNTSHLRKLK